MSQPVIQTSFNAGEWAPELNARVDLAKYHSAAALLLNFFVDYRGGATTRPGSRYCLQTLETNGINPPRLIPFQASLTVSYMIEFGAGYCRFYSQGNPILESYFFITNVTQANPGVVTTSGPHGYANGNWVFIQDVQGMTELNGNYYVVQGVTTNTFELYDLFGNPVNTTTYTPYSISGTTARIYTISSPYAWTELYQLKYVQNVNQLIICHPNHPPYALTEASANSWAFTAIDFVPTIPSPSAPSISSSAATGTDAVEYVITAVDINGQESIPVASTVAGLALLNPTSAWTNTLTWVAVTGAVSYNVYRTVISASNTIPSGINQGFIGNCSGTSFLDTNITPDFSQTPPLLNNPFSGSGIQNLTLTGNGTSYTSVPAVVIAAPPSGVTATATCALTTVGLTIANAGVGYSTGQICLGPNGIQVQVSSIGGAGQVLGYVILNSGQVTAGNVPSNPMPTSVSGAGGTGLTLNGNWAVGTLTLTNPGSGYVTAPSVTFSGGGGSGAAATATLGASSSGNPTVPGFIQQRLTLAGPVLSPSQLNYSQPGSPFNFNVSLITQPDDAIQETLTNTTLNSIKSLTAVAAGQLVLTDKGAWVINGGGFGVGISATSIVANPQTYSGSNDLPPLICPNDILYMKSQGSVVVDLTYNFYLSNYTGTDISILSSHLFYGYTFPQWTWAEEPFKLAWAVRSDGVLVSLTFVKEQELIAWTHHNTQGTYYSVASVTENTSIGVVSAVYTIVGRRINGQFVQYVERFAELTYPNDYKSSWQVDAGIGYNGAAQTTFSGAQHLGGAVVTGVADGTVINFTMPVSGTFVFGPGGTAGLTGIPSASIVTVGLGFEAMLNTLALDLGEPTVQGKRKKVGAVTVRVANALGLYAGKLQTTIQPMKDLVLGNIGTMSNASITGLQTTDTRIILDPYWDVFGQFWITQPNPYPASVLGVIPEIEVGDSR